MSLKIVLLLSIILSGLAHASSQSDEFLYNSYKSSLYQSQNKLLVTGNESLYVDALWDAFDEGGVDQKLIKTLNAVPTFLFPVAERLRLAILKLKFDSVAFEADLVKELVNILTTVAPDRKIIYLLASHEGLLVKNGYTSLVVLAKNIPAYRDISDTIETDSIAEADEVSDLYLNNPDVTPYMGGEYSKSVKIFMFCQHNRLFPCLLVMRDSKGQPVRNADGSIWTHRALASAVTGLPSYQRNGNTPSGVYTIDSVMPAADQQISYGKFRRMILNFVPTSGDEKLIKSLLPKSSWASDWWKPGTVARDIGRNLLRIHGTGKLGNLPGTPYFPFSRTHGCVSQRENTYEGVPYQDQRILLDQIMTSLELEAKYVNEPKIKGILYLVDLNDRNAPLKAADLATFGIE